MAHQECTQGVDKRVRPWQGVSLAFILHPSVLEPHLERGKEGRQEELNKEMRR